MADFAIAAAADRAFDFSIFSGVDVLWQYTIDICLKGLATLFAKGIHFFILIICIWHKSPLSYHRRSYYKLSYKAHH